MDIIYTKPGALNFHCFEEVQHRIFQENSPGYHQSESIPSHLLDTAIVVLENNIPLARLCIYHNPSLVYQEQKAAAIGNYACSDHKELSALLFSSAIDRIRKTENRFVIGPMNGSTWNNYRFSLHHGHPPFLLEPWNPLYYNEQFESAGFRIISRYYSDRDETIPCDHPAIMQREEELLKTGVIIRPVNMEDYEGELRLLHPFLSLAFQTNFLYTPIALEPFIRKYKEAAPLIQPEYVRIAENKDGNLIGFLFCYDDVLNKAQKNLVVKTIARHPAPEWKGLGHVMANQVIRIAKQKRYHSLIHAFMIEGATSAEASRDFNGKPYQNYALYGKQL